MWFYRGHFKTGKMDNVDWLLMYYLIRKESLIREHSSALYLGMAKEFTMVMY